VTLSGPALHGLHDFYRVAAISNWHGLPQKRKTEENFLPPN
jgi:hypothetical protein